MLVTVAVAALLLAACDSDVSPPAATPTPTDVAVGPSGADGSARTFDLRDSTSTVHVEIADLHGPLYRVATPTGTAAHPVAAVSGHTVAVNLVGGSTSVDVTLAAGRPWTVQLSAGASTLTVDASGGTLAGLTTLAGVSAIDVTAAAPHGLVTIREVGGTSSLDLHVPDGTGVQVQAHGGAGSVSLFGRSHQGVPGGGTFSTPGFGGDGYRIDAEAGVSSIVVDSTS